MLLAAKLVLLLSVAVTWWLDWSFILHGVATVAFLVLVHGAIRGRYRPSFGEALAIALGLRVLVLPLAPSLSDDYYRYLYEGNLVLHGQNPYLLAPGDAPQELRLPDSHLINHPEVPAAYPPAAQLAVALAVWIHPGPLALKVLFGTADLLTFLVLWSWLGRLGLPPARAIVHGYCPLMVLEFAGEGHNDSLAALFLVLALWTFTMSRPFWASACLGLATAAKLLPAVFLPFVCRQRPWSVVPFLAVLLVLYAWFLAPGMFAGTIEYGSEWTGNASVFAVLNWGSRHLLEWIHTTFDTKLFGLVYFPHNLAKVPNVLLGLYLLFRGWRQRWQVHQVVAAFMVFFVACTPTLHPWYLALFVPFLCIYPNGGWLLFSGTVFLAHEPMGIWLAILAYLPFYAGLVYFLSSRRR